MLWFSEEKGYGFIEDGRACARPLGEGFRALEEGGKVEFVCAEDESRQRRAARVEAVG